MVDTTEKEKKDEHYVCYGGCRGVAKSPGACKTPGCVHQGHVLVKCECADDKHNDFKSK